MGKHTAPPSFVPAILQPQAVLLQSDKLFAQSKEVLIQHQGELYRLQLTRNGKLILIK
ncbi:hemin uptake protein HemP [Neisseriaceae bacterium TC5R-5]|nr:hemin uptake protein HemP [Neisseriaceae bacterium TC5R-5]